MDSIPFKRRPPMKASRLLMLAMFLAATAFSSARAFQQQGPVKYIEPPLKLPAVGNLDAVKQWRMGRLQEVLQVAGPDINLRIRIADGSVLQVVGPGAELAELAWQSNWITTATKTSPGRSDYVERMIAFDVDANNRIIAMMSLETVARDRRRLRRALGN
jgi:hypothetical protein